jgi:hypothetical protein
MTFMLLCNANKSSCFGSRGGSSSPKSDPEGKLRSAKKAPRCKTGAPSDRPPQSLSMTDKNPPGAVSPIGGDVVAAVVRGGVGSAIGVSSSRGITPVSVAMAVTVAGVTVAGVAVGAVVRGASFDTAKVGLAAAIETTQSGSTIETRPTTRDVTRRCARRSPWRKARGKSGRRPTEWRTTRETRRRTTGTEARRRTGEHRRRTRRRTG